MKHTTYELHLSQTKYAKNLMCKINMQQARNVSTPMTVGEKPVSYGSDEVISAKLYRSVVEALQYLTVTRPEISFSVNTVYQFMHRPLEAHWKAVKRILRYMSGTLDNGLHLRRQTCSSLILTRYCDVHWASDVEDRKSISGFCLFLGINLISWQSKK